MHIANDSNTLPFRHCRLYWQVHHQHLPDPLKNEKKNIAIIVDLEIFLIQLVLHYINFQNYIMHESACMQGKICTFQDVIIM